MTFGQQTYNGVAILSRMECDGAQRGYTDDAEGAQSRLLATKVGGIQVVNVYIPNGQMVGSEKYQFKLEWLRRLRAFFDTQYESNTPVLLCGDFNVAPEERDVHDVRLWQGRILFSDPERAALQEVKDWGFTDAFRLHTEAGGSLFMVGLSRRSIPSQSWAADRPHLDQSATGGQKHKHLDRYESAHLGAAIRSRAGSGRV